MWCACVWLCVRVSVFVQLYLYDYYVYTSITKRNHKCNNIKHDHIRKRSTLKGIKFLCGRKMDQPIFMFCFCFCLFFCILTKLFYFLASAFVFIFFWPEASGSIIKFGRKALEQKLHNRIQHNQCDERE